MFCKRNSIIAALFIGLMFNGTALLAHCQIPCGIYNDQLRIVQLREHVTTIEKSINQITELSKAGDINYNQLVRWVNNKEDHANQFQEIVTSYFQTQRIKPVEMSDKAAYQKYTQQAVLLHQMLVYAMKTKQTTDLANCQKLLELIDGFVASYFSVEDQKHLMEHDG